MIIKKKDLIGKTVSLECNRFNKRTAKINSVNDSMILANDVNNNFNWHVAALDKDNKIDHLGVTIDKVLVHIGKDKYDITKLNIIN